MASYSFYYTVMGLSNSCFIWACPPPPTRPSSPYSFFGHFSHRSEWQLIKIDYKSLYSRKCTEEDYQTWHLHNQVRKEKVSLVTSQIMVVYVSSWQLYRLLLMILLVVPTGWAVCDGTKTNLHEAQARKLLHAGKGLLQNPLSRVLYLPSSWFWMVRRCAALHNSYFFTSIKGDYVSLYCLLNESFINNDVCSPTPPHM